MSEIKPKTMHNTKYKKEINIDWKILNLKNFDNGFFPRYIIKA